MCGIIGFIGKRNCANVLIDGLRRLEYRGYDSAGIAVISKTGLELRRKVGKVSVLADCVKENPVDGFSGVGHTRWATHGKPSEVNAHPHTDCDDKIVIVHNGIIENFIPLKERLQKEGHIFKSETDTEVIVHLIEEKIKTLLNAEKDKEKVLFEAVRLTVKEIEGAFALEVLWADCPTAMIAVKKQSPMVVGIGKGENFIASDIPAFLDYTRDVVLLNDNEIAVVKADSVELFNTDGKSIPLKITRINWDRAMAEKGGYEHFMLKEIHEQPRAVEDTLRARLTPFNDEVLLREFGMDYDFVRRLEQIQITACGTAYHAGMIGKYIIEHLAGIPVHTDIASEYRYRQAPLSKNALLIAISQSGETADTLGAVVERKDEKAHTLAICNVMGSSITRSAGHSFYTHCGPEISVASTKAFVGQLTSLYVLALHLAIAKGKMTPAQGKNFARQLMHMPVYMREVLSLEVKIKSIAERTYNKGHYLFLGRDVNFPVALEGALKIKEISYVHAEGFAGGEMKHGPIAIIDEGMPVISIAVKSRVYEKMISNIRAAQARGAHIIGIVTKGNGSFAANKEDVIEIPEVDEYLSPLLTIIPLQLFAYYVAKLRGCEIDQPRNLAKSVTVE